MRKLLYSIFAATAMAMAFAACSNDVDDADTSADTWDKYADWREANTAWFNGLRDSLDADGARYYTVLTPKWNPKAEVLIHYFNNRELTEGNLRPYFNSTCDFIYYGRLYNSTPFDSSYLNTANGKAIARLRPSQTIQGVAIALMDMHVGDTVEVVVPYSLAYNNGATGVILPYSALRFNIGLKDIPAYEMP